MCQNVWGGPYDRMAKCGRERPPLTVFGGMYFYHSMFHAKAQRGFWLKLFTASDSAAITASAAYGAATHLDLPKGRAELRGGRHVLWLWVGCLSGGARSVAAAPLLLG